MKKTKWILGLLVVISFFSVSLAITYFKNTKQPTENIKTVRVMKRTLNNTVVATGTVKPMVGAEVKVGSRISGRLEKLHVSVGDSVKKDQVIAELDSRELKSQVLKANADLQMAQAKLAVVKNGARLQEINQVRANVDQAEANLRLNESNYKRQLELFKESAVSAQQIEQTSKEYSVAKAQYQAVKEQLSSTENKYTSQDSLIAQAQITQAKAILSNAETQLSYATIKAPILGTIATVSTQEGETVAAGTSAPTFVTIIDLKRLQVDTYIDETDIGKIQIGQQAQIGVDAYPDEEFEGQVVSISPKALIDNNVVYYVASIKLKDTKELLKPDMTANVTILLAKRENVLTVPNEAIKRENGEKVVYILENEVVKAKPVKTGWKDNRYTEVVKGITLQDKIVIKTTNKEIENKQTNPFGGLPK